MHLEIMYRQGTRFVLPILCSILILTTACIEVDDEEGDGSTSGVGIPCIVAAHYLMWWQPEEGGHWTKGTIGTPLLGEYDSRSSAVISQHIDWASQYGIDVFCLQWSGEENNALIDLYLQAPNVEKLQFAIFYDCDIRFGSQPTINFDDDDVYNTFLDDLQSFLERYSQHAKYFRSQGRPVIWIYAAGNFTGAWREALVDIKNWAANRGYAEPYLIGDVMWGNCDEIKQEVASHYSAVFAYTGYHRNDIHGQSMEEYAVEMTARYYEWRLLLSVPVHPPLFPGYNDTAFRSGNPPLESQDPDDFETMSYMARQSSDKMPGSNQGLVFIASWNEWHEGTTIEPTAESDNYPREYGFGHLGVISQTMKRPPAR